MSSAESVRNLQIMKIATVRIVVLLPMETAIILLKFHFNTLRTSYS